MSLLRFKYLSIVSFIFIVTMCVPPQEKSSSDFAKEKAKLETEVFYFIEVNETITQIEPHKRRAADAFPSHQDQLEEYIKDNRLKFRGDDEEKDLIQLVKYYNSIAN